jgi:hypothetical protein
MIRRCFLITVKKTVDERENGIVKCFNESQNEKNGHRYLDMDNLEFSTWRLYEHLDT